ncbi:MAG TPA: hypothetical protein VK631_15975 [Solirubrobacteraceae bacterium]|nr:hypothetical protein [Solirubrobacteraceae bacterium]
MPARITHVRFHRTAAHDAIVAFRWRLENGLSGETDRITMVEWLEQGNDAIVGDGREFAPVAVVRMPGFAPFIQCHAGGQWTDRLLALPTF